MSVGKRIAEERKRLGLSQAAFAALVGVSFSTQRRYEDGRSAPPTTYLNAAGEVGVDVSYVMGWGAVTPAEKLNAALFSIKAGETGEDAQCMFGGADIPGHRQRYAEEFGWLLLSALELSNSDWNKIAEKLIKLDSSGTPLIDGNDPAWGVEIAKASRLIQRQIEEASALDSDLLARVAEAIEDVIAEQGQAIPAAKKARAMAMLYRAFKASGKVDPAMIEEAVKLAAG